MLLPFADVSPLRYASYAADYYAFAATFFIILRLLSPVAVDAMPCRLLRHYFSLVYVIIRHCFRYCLPPPRCRWRRRSATLLRRPMLRYYLP